MNTATEVRTIKTLFDRSTQLVGRDFNQAEIQRHLTNNSVSILHLSPHGSFSSDPRQTFIAMADGTALDFDRLRMMLTRQRSQPLDLSIASKNDPFRGR